MFLLIMKTYIDFPGMVIKANILYDSSYLIFFDNMTATNSNIHLFQPNMFSKKCHLQTLQRDFLVILWLIQL